MTMGFSDHCVISFIVILITVLGIHGGGYILVEAQNTNFSYPYSFSSPDKFSTVEDVQYYPGKGSFLLNSWGYALMSPSCAQLYYKDPVRMKDTASGAVVSFSTAFTFSISGLDYYQDDTGYFHGDGFAFTFARNNTDLGGVGGSLCLLKSDSNGLPSNQVFAVEFDTYRNPSFGDVSDNHIGVDVNSMNSSWSFNLCGGKVHNCTYLVNGGSFTSWIDYNNTTQKLQVYFTKGSLSEVNMSKPLKPVIEATQPLVNLFDEYMYIGFSASIGLFSEVHEIQAWQFASSELPQVVAPVAVPPPVAAAAQPPAPGGHGKNKVGIIAGVSAGFGVVALLLVGILDTKYRRRASFTKQGNFDLVDRNLVPRVFTYKELSKATMNFSKSEMLGSGGFGAVYKGVLPSGALIAVKRMQHESKHGEEGFLAEAASLSQIRHRNLVQLRGWCHEKEQLMLVYDYMCNGSLDDWLFLFPKRKSMAEYSLPLTTRHSILSGVAAALSYLHEECKHCVLHRDIKSSNVLLDEDLNAYLGDFGLARLIDHKKFEKTTLMAGTLGYMAPEMPHTGKVTKESDVYSFGVLMLEVMCGTRPLDISAIERGDGTLVDRTWYAHESGNILRVADVKLGPFDVADFGADFYAGMELQQESSLSITHNSSVVFASSIAATEETKKMVTSLLHLALLCCHPNPEDRPSMRLVSQALQASESMELCLPALPERRPHARYYGRGFSEMQIICSNSTSLRSDNVQDAGQGSSYLSTLTSSGSSAGEHAKFQGSIASITSSISTGH